MLAEFRPEVISQIVLRSDLSLLGSKTHPPVGARRKCDIPDKIYLFQNDDYARHSFDQGSDPGYPKEIDGAWSGWPREEWRDPPGEHLIRIDAALYYPGT